jgi:ribosomal protein S6E (S10)
MRKKITTKDRVDFLLSQLNKHYDPEKTEYDYRKILQGMTNNSDLIDLAMKAWEKNIIDIEGKSP